MAAANGAGAMGPAAYTGQTIEGFRVCEDTVISLIRDSAANDITTNRLRNIATLKAGTIIRASKAQKYFTAITVVSGSINDVTTMP